MQSKKKSVIGSSIDIKPFIDETKKDDNNKVDKSESIKSQIGNNRKSSLPKKTIMLDNKLKQEAKEENKVEKETHGNASITIDNKKEENNDQKEVESKTNSGNKNDNNNNIKIASTPKKSGNVRSSVININEVKTSEKRSSIKKDLKTHEKKQSVAKESDKEKGRKLSVKKEPEKKPSILNREPIKIVPNKNGSICVSLINFENENVDDEKEIETESKDENKKEEIKENKDIDLNKDKDKSINVDEKINKNVDEKDVEEKEEIFIENVEIKKEENKNDIVELENKNDIVELEKKENNNDENNNGENTRISLLGSDNIIDNTANKINKLIASEPLYLHFSNKKISAFYLLMKSK